MHCYFTAHMLRDGRITAAGQDACHRRRTCRHALCTGVYEGTRLHTNPIAIKYQITPQARLAWAEPRWCSPASCNLPLVGGIQTFHLRVEVLEGLGRASLATLLVAVGLLGVVDRRRLRGGVLSRRSNSHCSTRRVHDHLDLERAFCGSEINTHCHQSSGCCTGRRRG